MSWLSDTDHNPKTGSAKLKHHHWSRPNAHTTLYPNLSANLHCPLCPCVWTEGQIQTDAHMPTSGWTGPNSHHRRNPQASAASHVRPHHLGGSWALSTVVCSCQASDTHHERRGRTNYPSKCWGTMEMCRSRNVKNHWKKQKGHLHLWHN